MKATPAPEDKWLQGMPRGWDGIQWDLMGSLGSRGVACSLLWDPGAGGSGPPAQRQGLRGAGVQRGQRQHPGWAQGRCGSGSSGASPAPLWGRGQPAASPLRPPTSAAKAFISFPFPSGQGKHFFDM